MRVGHRGGGVNPSDVVTLAILAVIAVVPFAMVFLVALLRGYTIHLSMRRPDGGRANRRRDS